MQQKKQRLPFWNNPKIVPYLYILPNMILFLTFMIIPIIMTFYYSMFKWNGVSAMKFIAFDNYRYLFGNEIFWKSLWNTVYYSLATVPFIMILALLFAIMLNQKLFFKGFFRSSLYVTSIISTVVAGTIFKWLFNNDVDLINYILTGMGLSKIEWSADPKWAMMMIIIATLWQRIGYNMVIYLGGLQGISSDYYEAAVIDGANTWQKFFHITLPLLRSTTVFVLITTVVHSFRSFDLIYIMTQGGPLNSTKTLVMYIYQQGFQDSYYGRASAAGVILFLILLVFTALRLYNDKRKEA